GHLLLHEISGEGREMPGACLTVLISGEVGRLHDALEEALVLAARHDADAEIRRPGGGLDGDSGLGERLLRRLRGPRGERDPAADPAAGAALVGEEGGEGDGARASGGIFADDRELRVLRALLVP